MKSSKGKGLIGLLMIIAVVAVFGWFGYSSMGDIKLGLDLAGGVSITYQAVEENPTAEQMSDTIYKTAAEGGALQHGVGGVPGRLQPD